MPDDATPRPVHDDSALHAALVQALGPDNVSTAPETTALFSQDIFSKAARAAAYVITPHSTEDAARAVAVATQDGRAVIARGGGMSYTGGYLPTEDGAVMVDMSAMDRILEINEEDMYVTVEAGCTWAALYDALKAKNLRTPFWGPLSGLSSTIGGGLSQNNAFFGAGTWGTTADCVTSLTVVTADGSVVKTGSGGTQTGAPFFRHYGPDLTGVFLGDTGALGFKTEATFRLMPMPAAEDYASFEFKTPADVAAALSAWSRAGLGCELFAFDPNLQKLRLKRASLMQDVKSLTGVVKGQKNLLSGVKEAAKVAMAGRTFVDEASYSAHIVVEGRSDAAVAEDMKAARAIAAAHSGTEVANTMPKVTRSTPFSPLNNVIGPEGERWAPVHGIVPHSKAENVWAAIDKLFLDNAAEIDRHGVLTGYLVTTLSTNGFLIEPVFFWPEEIYDIHRQTVEPSYLAKITERPANPAATETVARLRSQIMAIFQEAGAVHFQIGKAYPYKESLRPETLALLEDIKSAVDARRRVNPGSLGLT
ncbi:MAG: FAD-binding oxidoreductase [Pseudomonadota bacterium]